MKNLFIALISALLLFGLTGCKVPGSVITGIDNLATKAESGETQLKEIEQVVRPLLAATMQESQAQIKTLDEQIAKEEDPIKKKGLESTKSDFEKIVKNCTKAGEYLDKLLKDIPKITRNLKQASKTLKAFNGLSDALKPEEQPETPKPGENVSETP